MTLVSVYGRDARLLAQSASAAAPRHRTLAHNGVLFLDWASPLALPTRQAGYWVGDVAGEFMTTNWSSPTTDEMGETRGAAHVKAVDVLVLRVRQESGLGARGNPELLP